MVGAQLIQAGQHLLLAAATQFKQQERIAIQRIAQHIVHRRHMLAGTGPIITTAIGVNVMRIGREQALATAAEQTINVPGHFTIQQLRGEQCLLTHGLHDLVP